MTAFVNASQLTRELQDQIETMRTRGAPADERGRAVWEILIESTGSSIETRVRRFLTAMEEAALLDRIEGEGEVQYRQTLNAAVEMSLSKVAGMTPSATNGRDFPITFPRFD